MTTPIKYTHTALITLVSMNGSLGAITAEFEVAGTKKLDGTAYLDDVIGEAYQSILAEQNVKVDAVAVNISGIYSANKYHRFLCHVTVVGVPENGPAGKISDEIHVFVDRDSFKPISNE